MNTSAFIRGKSPTTSCDSYMFFGVDGELMSVKWRYYKMIKCYMSGPGFGAINHGYTTSQLPSVFRSFERST